MIENITHADEHKWTICLKVILNSESDVQRFALNNSCQHYVQLLFDKTAHLTSVTLLPHTNASITAELANVVHNNSHTFVHSQPQKRDILFLTITLANLNRFL